MEAGLGSDLPLLLGITVITAAIVFLGNLIADLLYGVVDPGSGGGGQRMRREKRKNRRQETAVFLILAVSLLTAVTIAGIFLKDAAMETDFSSKNLAPSMSHLFGTDWMGRDKFARTLAACPSVSGSGS